MPVTVSTMGIMMKHILFAALLASATTIGIAYAQPGGPGPDLPFGDMTLSQAKAKAAALFARLDVNHDGKLDHADQVAHQATVFDRMDADHNGQISRAEFMAERGHGPDDMAPEGGPDGPGGPHDRDMHGPGMHGPGMHGPDMHGPGMHGPDMHGPGGRGGMMAMARMADTNHDGAISQAEFTTAAMKRFADADTNHDGKLSAAERQAEHARMRAQWHGAPDGSEPPPPPPPPTN